MNRTTRIARRVAIGFVAALLVALLVLAIFPWGMLRPQVEAALSRRFGSDIAIGSVERVEAFSYRPTLIVRGLRVAQPSWAGEGDLLLVKRLDLRFDVLPILVGRFSLRALAVDGARARLVRTAGGRENWAPDRRGGGGSAARFTTLTIRDLVIDLNDAKAGRHFTVRVASDAKGFAVRGTGAIDGAPVEIALLGPPIARAAAWPFEARVRGRTIDMLAKGQMAYPLDTGEMTVDIAARADDLKTLDAVIEAGLFGTQPLRLNARVRHARGDWFIDRLAGTIGRSRLASAEATVRKRGGRTAIDGRLHFATLDFDDLANDEGLARARAIEARIGERIVPGTRVNLAAIGDTGGTIRVRADRLLAGTGSPLRSLTAALTLDRQRLTVAPLTIALTRGRITGRALVDNRGRTVPMVTLDLRLADSSIATFGRSSAIDAPLEGMVRLQGPGDTIRAAVGRSSGTVALVARGGRLPGRLASILGADVARGILTDDDSRAALHCAIVRVDAARGQGRFNPLLVDTSRARTQGTGTLDLSTERLALALTGTPKQRTLLRLDRPVTVGGTLAEPNVSIPPGIRQPGGILRMIGRAIRGDPTPRPGDADCDALAQRAMRR